MIQIKSTLARNLDQICETHFDQLEASLRAQIPSLKKKQRDFISGNLKAILTGKPEELSNLHKAYLKHCTTGQYALKSPNIGLSRIFNYKWFTKKDATHYCGYDLAKSLGVNTCPYCNRNYTVTVADGKSRVVRPDFDHFFPHKKYPLLALSFYNLIPSCLICNRTVKNQAMIVHGKYIHPYEEGFGNTLKFNFFPLDTDSSIGTKSNYSILPQTNVLEPKKVERCLASYRLFQIEKIYKESHCGEITDIVRKHYVSNGKYLEILHKSFPAFGTIDELYRIAFGAYYDEDDFEKRPLSKLTKDVTEQLVFNYPILSNNLKRI